jgi:paraquat-inducible protein B
VEKGLKAELEMQSLVTGQLGIHLDFFPDQPARFVGTEPEYTEIPTVESRLSEFVKSVQNLPLEEIAQKMSKALDGIVKLENSPELQDTIASLAPAVQSAQVLFKNLDYQIKPLVDSTKLTVGEAKKMFANASKLATDVDARIPEIVAGLNETLKSTSVTMKGANKAIDGIAGDNSPVRIQLVKTLDEFASAARSLRVLADYIEQNPEALIRGKRR